MTRVVGVDPAADDRAKKRVVGVDSPTDEVTRDASNYRRKHVYPYLKGQDFAVTRIAGTNATRGAVARAVTREETVYVTGVGHGELNSYSGTDGTPLFFVGGYEAQEVSAKIIHLMSCLTAIELGPDMVKSGATAFFGYDAEIWSSDDAASCDAEIDKGFADGLTAEEVYQRTMSAFDARIRELDGNGEPHFASRLELNQAHLCAPSTHARFGSVHARL